MLVLFKDPNNACLSGIKNATAHLKIINKKSRQNALPLKQFRLVARSCCSYKKPIKTIKDEARFVRLGMSLVS